MIPNFANTIISGRKEENATTTVAGLFHLALWITAATLGIYVNGLAKDYINADNGYPNVPNEGRPVTGTTTALGITATVCILFGIVHILIHACIQAGSRWQMPCSQRMSLFGMATLGDVRLVIEAPIIATTTFSTVVTIYMFGLAGKNADSKYFDWAFATVIVQTWAQLLLCANLKEVEKIEYQSRKTNTTTMNFMAAIVTSVEIVTTTFVLSNDAVSNIQDRQKAVVFAAPFLAGGAFFMKTMHDHAKNSSTESDMMMGMTQGTMFKSLTKLAYVAAVVCAFYKLSLVTLQQSDPTFYMFTLLNVLFSTSLFIGMHMPDTWTRLVMGRDSRATIAYTSVTAP